MSQAETKFCVGSSTMKRRRPPMPKLEPNDPRILAANEARDVRTHSSRALTLLTNVWQGYEHGGPHPQEAMCLLAAVDDAARAVRGMLTQMGERAIVERWGEMVTADAQRPPKKRAAKGKR